ncbi:MAG: CBS domain-containing protein [Candidatus Thermoplasmatota archaeon]
MKIRDIMVKDVITVDKDDNLKHVINLMRKYNITKIPVLEKKKLIGIATDNMIAYKLGSWRKRSISTSRLHASSVMEKDIEIMHPDAPLELVLQKVGKPGPTMIPLVEKEDLVGVITKADLLPLVNNQDEITSILQTNILTVSPEDRVIHARHIMIENDIARLPVVDKGKLLGVISDFEIALAFAHIKKSFSLGRQKHKLDELLVKDTMKTPAIWTTPSTKITDAARIMMKMNVGFLPVLKDETLVGVVSRTDLLRTIKL